MVSLQGQTSQDIIDLLISIPLSKKNINILSKHYAQLFSSFPEEFASLMHDIKKYIQEGEQQAKMCEVYLKIFSFLCEKFGVFSLKLDLDDLCFSILEPKEYTHISKALEHYKQQSQEIIDSIYKRFAVILDEHNIDAEIVGRYKNIYSVYRKCKKRGDFDALRLADIFAFRIITQDDRKSKCFEVLHLMHDHFRPLPHRYKDYISIPKINGYQSLHTGLLGIHEQLDIAIELQIRTKEMHEIAEHGVAAHYLYAREKKSSLISEKEQKLYQHMLLKGQTAGQIHCLTPEKDIITLTPGASVTDFANKIHSKLKKNAKFPKVDNIKRQWSYKIQPWQTIEIIK